MYRVGRLFGATLKVSYENDRGVYRFGRFVRKALEVSLRMPPEQQAVKKLLFECARVKRSSV